MTEGRESASGSPELKGFAYELFVLLVSLLSAVNTVIVLVPFLRDEIKEVALLVDGMIVPVFAVDFVYRLRTTRPRSLYLVRRYGWADFLSIFPTLGVFRLFRIARVIRLLRRESPHQLAAELDRTRARATFLGTLFLVIVVVEFAGMGVFVVEEASPEGNIRNASDAVWWGFVTVTTVGYGDRYPVTNAGRVIGTLLLFAGIALFSVLTGFIANVFLAPREGRVLRRRSAQPSLDVQIEELRTLLVEQEQRAGEIRRKVDELERSAVAALAERRDRLDRESPPAT